MRRRSTPPRLWPVSSKELWIIIFWPIISIIWEWGGDEMLYLPELCQNLINGLWDTNEQRNRQNPLDLISVITEMLERSGEMHNFHRFWQNLIKASQESRWMDELMKEQIKKWKLNDGMEEVLFKKYRKWLIWCVFLLDTFYETWDNVKWTIQRPVRLQE